MELFDIAIIGAGPGGNYAALTAAKAGVSVVVLEEHEAIGQPVHCGECLSQAACKRLGITLPDEAISREVKGIRLIFPDKTASFITEPGYTLEKDKFEQWLSLEATKAGAAYKLKSRVAALEREEGGWHVTTTAGEYFARLIIDASGVDSAASKLLNFNPPQKTVVGLQYEMEQVDVEGEMMDFLLWPRLAPHGYLWVIPKKDGRSNVGLVTNDAPRTRELLEKFVDEYGLKEKKRNKAFGGRIPAGGPVAKTFDDGIMLIGDAAGFTSPMFEGGTSLSMTSGKFAAEVAAEALKKNDVSKAALTPYESKWRAAFPNYARLVGGKEKMYGFTDDELNKIGKLIPRDLTIISQAQRLQIGASVLFTAPQLLAKGFIPAMETLGQSRAEHFGW
ncbi:MAG: NAD(P)/FAD-dependent oxidoreductase [Candidatus Micrarchaeota archaeon]|nr:NAD(P)/FAD-dependent oxidoreductase [Candidatus Micrarchaeota archaeon]